MATKANSELVAELADLFAQVSAEMLDYRIENKSKLTKDQRIQIEDAETTVDGFVAILRGTATRMIVEEAKTPLSELKAQIHKANNSIAKIKRIKAVLNLISAILTAAAAVVVGDVKGLITATESLKKANEAVEKLAAAGGEA